MRRLPNSGMPRLESPIVIEGYSTAGDQGSRLADSRTRAILVREYLNTRFQIDLQNIGTVALLARVPPAETHKNSWDGVCIVLLKKARLDQ